MKIREAGSGLVNGTVAKTKVDLMQINDMTGKRHCRAAKARTEGNGKIMPEKDMTEHDQCRAN